MPNYFSDNLCVYVCCQVDSQQTLRDLRLQFAEQISLFAADRNCSDIMETVYRGNKTNC